MKFSVVMAYKESDLAYINECVNSLLQGTMVPDEILLTVTNGLKIPTVLKKISKVKVSTVEGDYGCLSALVGAMQHYSVDENVYMVFLNSNCTYPQHLLQEYAMSVTELERQLKEKLPDSNGSVFGLGGVVMVQDKNRSLALEFQQLIGETNEPFEKRNVLGYVKENATVDFLESTYSMLIHRSLIKDDFLVYLAKVMDRLTDLSVDVLLSNYFAKNKVLRTQICNFAINRFMLLRSGYLNNHKELPDNEKRDLYDRTVKYLRKLDCFYAYDLE